MTVSKEHSLFLQPRDMGLLRELFECRVMTTVHVASLHFDGKAEYSKKRLQKLKAAGYIGERRRNANERGVLFLTRKGFAHLKNAGALSQYPSLSANSFEARARVSPLTLRHELEVMDVKSSFHSALTKSQAFSIVNFSTWPLLNQFETPRSGLGADVLVKPDGFIRIYEKGESGGLFEHIFFLEVDRSSETLDTLASRAEAYLSYHRSGGFAVRNGATPDRFREFPFRVLMVLKSSERRNNIAERLATNVPPILSKVWLATFAEVSTNPLDAIWIEPKNYREITKGTRFEIGPKIPAFGYQRQSEREIYIESNVKKSRLFED